MLHNGTSQLECELAIFSLDDDPAYVALSYCGTKAQPCHEILLNGFPIHVKPNLYDYLEIMKKEKLEDWTFIDALCINQQDEIEQANEATLLSDVYRNAQQVVAWLGAQSSIPQEVLHILQSVCTDEEKLLTFIQHDDAGGQLSWFLLQQFTDQEYWTRLWNVQEVLLARDLVLRVNTFRVRADLLYSHIRASYSTEVPKARDPWMLAAKYDMDAASRSRISQMIELPSQRRARRRERRMIALLAILEQRARVDALDRGSFQTNTTVAVSADSSLDCLRVHEKVFGLIGITHIHMKPDHNTPLPELYLRVLLQAFFEQVFDKTGHSESNEWVAELMFFLSRLYRNINEPFSDASFQKYWRTALEQFDIPPGRYDVLLESFLGHQIFGREKLGKLAHIVVRLRFYCFKKLRPHRYIACITDSNYVLEDVFKRIRNCGRCQCFIEQRKEGEESRHFDVAINGSNNGRPEIVYDKVLDANVW